MQQPDAYEFGPFRIDRTERVLRRGAQVIALAPKAVETLFVLAANGGRVVEKDELIKRVWPDTFVEEGGLARNISLLRKVLGRGPDDAEYIETVPRRGYRLVAHVTEVGEDAGPSRSLAVLPLANLSGDPAEDFFADGMTEELISYFMKIEALRVCSRTSAMVYKDVNRPLRQIARELGVHWVVEGTVRQSGGRVRITVRLMEGATEKHLWSETYDNDLRDVLTLQNTLAGDIAKEIRMKVGGPGKDGLARLRPVNPEAYQDYLRGRYFLNKRTTGDLQRAREYFRNAIDKDPTYAPAHSGLADTYALMASSGYDVMPPREAMPLARMAAANALEIDDTLAEGHAALGYVALVYDWDWPAAERHLQRAIELNPAYATAYQWRGELLMASGQLDQATTAFRRALELDPLSIPCNLGLGWSYYFCRNYDLAIEQYRKTLEIAPNVPMALYGLGLAYHHKNLPLEGFGEIRKAYEFSGGQAAAVMLVGVAHALSGNRKAAESELARLQELAAQKYVPAVYSAFIHSALDNLDLAFEWLQRACEERSSYLIFLKVQPSMENLRSDQRFRELLKTVGLK